MALSNWDTLAIDENSEATNGVFTSPIGVVVEFYKNWIYVRDQKAWEDGGSFCKPTIMQVTEGSFVYKDTTITAIRGPQNGIFAVVTSVIHPPQLTADCPKCSSESGAFWHDRKCPDYTADRHLIMVGCGVYGYEGSEFVGVSEVSKKFLETWIKGTSPSHIDIPLPPENLEAALKNARDRGERAEIIENDGEQVAKQDGRKVLRIFYEDPAFDESVRKLDCSKVLRFNQGDRFFANKMGFEVPATEVAKAEPTIMSKIVENMGKDNG